MATCPECDAQIEIDDDDLEDMEVGDPWDCDACGSHLRVASLDPLEFDPDEDEDEEEEEDEDAAAEEDDELGDLEDEDDEEDEDLGDWDE
jgi:alpha-aminoadipate carrier protein LysW